MSSKQATPLTGAIILGSFVVIALIVMFSIRGKLQSQSHESNHGSSWETVHSSPHHAVEEQGTQPRAVLASYESTPRPGAKVRTLKEFYSRRAYPGAPPVIAHEVQFDGVINDDCLSCHKDGGFVPEYNAYTPVTPHPEMQNCRQCHVAQTVEEGFVKTEWVMPTLPKRGRQAIPGGPLQIPHPLQFRENCLACHAGPQAVVEIRTSHPERQNCQQCHVVASDLPLYKSLIDPRMAHVEK
jgi:cytochrome c-type protein NapB